MTTLFNSKLYQQLFVFLQVIITSFFLLLSSDAFSNDIEYKIKAAYLYNFTKFIYWSPKNSLTFNLCLIGDDPFGDLIKPLEQKKVNGKKIRLFRYVNLSQSIQHCDIVYFTKNSTLKNIYKKNFKGILTIGEADLFIHKGGMLQLFKKNNYIRFHINQMLIEKNSLEISAKLLELADIIEDDNE